MNARKVVVAALVCSWRETEALTRLDARTLRRLVDQGDLVAVPWGRHTRITLESIQALARRGFTLDGTQPIRAASRPRRAAPAPGAGDRIRAIEVAP